MLLRVILQSSGRLGRDSALSNLSTVDYSFVWRVLESEGGYSNRKSDRGGETFRGITWKTYRAFCFINSIMPKRRELVNLTDEEVLSVYVKMFIIPGKIMSYESESVREVMFDASILHGQGSAITMAQRAINKATRHSTGFVGLKVDGINGPKTCSAINAQSPTNFINGLTIERILFVDRLVQRTVRKGDLSQVENLFGWHQRFLQFVCPV